MPKSTRTILALAAGSLALGLVGGGAAVADQGPAAQGTARYHAPKDGRDGHDDYDEDDYGKHRYSVGKVVSRGPLSVRSRPTTHSHLQYKVYPGETLALQCKTRGENVAGNDIWYLIDPGDDDRDDRGDWADGGDGEGRKKARDGRDRDGYEHDWVSARYVKDLNRVRWCRD
ncbi:hypothetical protein ABZ766_30020 [Streptomyces sp. NPDC006670]|uniref:hypothetical protein n=1 Tax=Streptomyces sp. NPDC006670 TaxID=3154476 RepID=UPI003407366B